MLTNQSTAPSNSHKKRDRLAIVSSMLSCARGGIIKTKLMCEVGLSSSQFENYVPDLFKSELLEIKEGRGKRLYQITRKGWVFLETFSLLMSLLESQEQADASLLSCHKENEHNEYCNNRDDTNCNTVMEVTS
jgi:predicted transcriptional regulator